FCYQIYYTACKCLYYQHEVDRCAGYGKRGHSIQNRTTMIGYACTYHSGNPDRDTTTLS
ncbi:hypothetical protein LZ32DRAFT_528945, partial [Colletotrichum eremochloae]